MQVGGPAGRIFGSAPGRTEVHSLGAVAFAGYLAMVLTSLPQAAVLWRTEEAPRAQALFDAVAASLSTMAPEALQAAFRWPVSTVLTLHAAALAVPTLAAVVLIAWLSGPSSAPGPGAVSAIRRWSVAFAIVCVFAYPILTQDFWLSAVWGRMIVGGANPFHQMFADTDVGALPLDHFAMTMSYGPLWAILSAAVMLLAGASVVLAGVLFKLLLLAAWFGVLWAVERLTADAPYQVQARAAVIVGWLPAGVHQTVAEGHNDVAMALGILLWLVLLTRGYVAAPVALAASALCKFASLPLGLVEAIVLARGPRDWRSIVVRVAGPLALGIATVALFYRSPAFFAGLHTVSDWHFLQPRDALSGIERLSGMPMGPLKDILPLVCAGAVLWVAVKAAWRQTIQKDIAQQAYQYLALAIMAAVILVVTPHFWPWYVVWVLALAAIQPGGWLAETVIGLAVLSPFALLAWWHEHWSDQTDLVSLLLYAGVVFWVLAMTRRTGRGPAMRPLVGAGEARK